ncbi:MAG TPA: tetratricopeptide repeat protein, partial [Blastocatellia bacterium]|nr:tetratricopeptide repeat protein [Blastocatellia bacterium]
HAGFVTVPESDTSSDPSVFPDGLAGADIIEDVFLFGASSDETANDESASVTADSVFNAASSLPSDTMPSLLRDELEGIDFYIAQGYVEIARDTLDRLRQQHGDHPEIASRYKTLGVSLDDVSPVVELEPEERQEPEIKPPAIGTVLLNDLPDLSIDAVNQRLAGDFEMSFSEPYAELGGTLAGEPVADAQETVAPFLVHKESGPLYPDLLVQLPTSELRKHLPVEDFNPPVVSFNEQTEQQPGTADLIDSLVSNISTSIDGSYQSESLLEEFESETPTPNGSGPADSPAEGEKVVSDLGLLEEPAEVVSDHGLLEEPAKVVSDLGWEKPAKVASESDLPGEPAKAIETPGAEQSSGVEMRRDELQEIFEELRDNTDDLKPLIDFETHFSLGLAYKDMELLDEAIGEFQMAFRMAGIEDLTGDYIHCCNMLGVCFKQKQMPKVAIRWFERGLKIPNRPEDEYQALRYEIGVCYEEIGEIDKAVDVFMEVYGTDVTYRGVADRIAQLQVVKSA